MARIVEDENPADQLVGINCHAAVKKKKKGEIYSPRGRVTTDI